MKYRIKEYADIKRKVEQMSLHELLEVVVCPNILMSGEEKVQYHTASMLLHPAPAQKCKDYIDEVRKNAPDARLICADLEFGTGNVAQGTTRFPSFMASKAAGGAEYAYKMGEICAKEAKAVGYNWTFSPCVDIAFNHNCPIISTRSAGETADEVIENAGAYMRAMQKHGLAATLKHFPGDGLCDEDQHLTTPENPLSMKEWYATYGRVYMELIGQGAKAIMPGHISLPAYDEKDEALDMYPPATLSKRLLTDLLKGELGFEGIIVSDAVNMGGFCGYMNYYDACCRFLECGGDVLLFAHLTPKFEEKMALAVEQGNLKLETLRNRAYRVLCFARELNEPVVGEGSAAACAENSAAACAENSAAACAENSAAACACEKNAEAAGLSCAEKNENAAKLAENPDEIVVAGLTAGELAEDALLAKEITERACTVVRDRGHLLPFEIKRDTKILHLMIHNNYVEEDVKKLTVALRTVSDHVEECMDPGADYIREIAENGKYDLIVCTVGCRFAFGMNVIRLHGVMARNMMLGWTKFDTPVIFVNHGNPWLGDEYKAIMDTLINTYGCTDYTAETVLRKITGK